WLGFRGGKGVATALGVVSVLGPWATLIAFGIFVVTFAVSRYVSLAAILASLAFGVCQIVLLRPEPFGRDSWSLTIFSLLVPLLIVLRHRSNIHRLCRGEEKPYRSA